MPYTSTPLEVATPSRANRPFTALDAIIDDLRRRGIRFDAGAFVSARNLEGVRLADLALAFACTSGDSAAVAYFEKKYVPQAVRALRRMKLPPALADDVLSWLRFELFVRPAKPLIATYSGRGDLGTWVRSIAVHEALKRVKRHRRELAACMAPELLVHEISPVRRDLRPRFTAALQECFARLTWSQRNLLRQHFLDGLSIDVLARLYRIHRSTAARRVDAARAELVARVKARLCTDLDLPLGEVDDLITLDNLDRSLSGLLRKTGP